MSIGRRHVPVHSAPAPARAHCEAALVALLAARGPLASVCPSEVARAIAAGTADWRALMPAVRDTAARLASQGMIRVTQGQREITLDERTRGPVRLRRGPKFVWPAGPEITARGRRTVRDPSQRG